MKSNTSDHKNLKKLYDKGYGHFKNEEFDKTIEYCTKIIELDSTHYSAWYLLGKAYLKRGIKDSNNEDYYKAIESYRKIIDLNIKKSNLWHAWEGMVSVYEELGNDMKVKECHDKRKEAENEYIEYLTKPKYMSAGRNKWITAGAGSIDDFIKTFEALAKKFKQWKEWGIKLDPYSSTEDDYAEFYTHDMDVAIKANFMITLLGDDENMYLLKDTGKEVKEVKVPKELLEKHKN